MYCFPVLLGVGLLPKRQNLNWSGIAPQKAKLNWSGITPKKAKIKLKWDYSSRDKN